MTRRDVKEMCDVFLSLKSVMPSKELRKSWLIEKNRRLGWRSPKTLIEAGRSRYVWRLVYKMIQGKNERTNKVG